MISRVSVSMGHRQSLEVTMMNIGDIDILAGIGVGSGAEADRGSTDEANHVEKVEKARSYEKQLQL